VRRYDAVGSHQHILSLRHGALKDKKRLFALLSGEAVDMPPPPPPGSVEESVEGEGQQERDIKGD
jgi:hypothetical protein